jgi:hypothetical protein
MKKAILAVFTTLATALLLTSCTLTQVTANDTQQRIINVIATGSVQVEPDIAVINIGVTSQNEDINDALDGNTANANAIKQTLMDLGVAEEDIQTSNFNVYPQQQQSLPETPDEPTQSQTVFVVQNTVSVTVRELGALGDILTAVVDEGANTINGISFSLDDPTAAIAEARQEAIANAEDQAQAIVEAAGVQLGEITSITINDSSPTMTRTGAVMEQAADSAVPIASGTLTIEVTANITYGIR